MTVVDDIGVETKLLSQVMEDWAQNLRLPVVQREFEWESDRIQKLLDSIVRGYPVGSVILWESGEDFPGSPLVDSDSDQASGITSHTYVIDGQQRLTALLLVRNGWKIKREGRDVDCDALSYNPANKRFYISEKKGIDVSLLVNAALGSAEALETLKEKYPSDYKAAIGEVGSKIIKYPLPLYVLKTKHRIRAEEDVATEIAEIFTRINSAGIPLGNIQLFLSFFGAAFSDLKKDMVDRYYEINRSYHQEFPSWEVMNRFIFSNLGMTQNQVTRIDSFKNGIRTIKDKFSHRVGALSKIIRRSYVAANVTLELITRELGIYNANRLPSQNAFLPLFKWVYKQNGSKVGQIGRSARRKMLRWFVTSSFNGMYSQYINRRIQKDLDAVESGTAFPLQELLKNMSREKVAKTIERRDIVARPTYYTNVFRDKSSLMLLNVVLFRSSASNWAGEVVTSKNTAVHHIFPREYLKGQGLTDDDSINDLGNLTLISSPINGEIGDSAPSEYLPKYAASFLRSHFIPIDHRSWKFENYEEFLARRTGMMWKAIDRIINSM